MNPEDLTKLEIEIPIRTVSEANLYQHWTKKHERRKKHRQAVSLFLNPIKDNIRLPCHVTLTRLAPRMLDADDNLPMSFKYIKDCIAEILTGDRTPGRADSDKMLSWWYAQEKKSKEYGIRVSFEFI